MRKEVQATEIHSPHSKEAIKIKSPISVLAAQSQHTAGQTQKHCNTLWINTFAAG